MIITLKKIAAKKTVAPLILLGDGGSGKSALLAHAAMQALETGKAHNACVFVRHIGGVPGIETLRTLLSSGIDIFSAYGESVPRGAKNTLELKQMLERSLSYAAEDKPLWLFLDGLDHLDADDNAWSLEWISQNLPANVRVVMSVRPSPVADAAVRKFARSIAAIPAMKPAEGSAMLSAWLEIGRKLLSMLVQSLL